MFNEFGATKSIQSKQEKKVNQWIQNHYFNTKINCKNQKYSLENTPFGKVYCFTLKRFNNILN